MLECFYNIIDKFYKIRLTAFTWNLLKFTNKKRLYIQRRVKVFMLDDVNRKKKERPKKIKRVLIVCVSDGWGNSLFLLGLCKRLYDNDLLVSVVVRDEFKDRFNGTKYIENIFSLNKELKNIVNFAPDLCLDIEYIALRYWKERVSVFKLLDCHIASTSLLAKESTFVDKYLNLRTSRHISERFAVIASYVLNKEQLPIYPEVRIANKNYCAIKEWILKKNIKVNKVVYLNCMARDRDRCLNTKQANAIIQELSQFGYTTVINIECDETEKCTLKENNKSILFLKKISFEDLCALIDMVDFVITPDTSVTHIASAVDKDSFVIFPPNDRDYWPEYRAADVWDGLSRNSKTYYQDDKNLKIDIFGYSNVRPGENGMYLPDILAKEVREFIRDNLK